MSKKNEREENLIMLLERGMSEEEVENFLTPGNRVVNVDLQLPPTKIEVTLAALSRLSIVMEPVKVKFCFARNRYEEFVKTAEDASGQKVLHSVPESGELIH